jgi:hypothetical protein
VTHDEAVVAYLEHGAGDPEVAAHIADCPSCRALIDELDVTRNSLSEPFAWDAPPAGLADSVMAAIVAEASGSVPVAGTVTGVSSVEPSMRGRSTVAPVTSASNPAEDEPVAPVVDLAAARASAGRWKKIARLTSAAAVVALVVAVGSLVVSATRSNPPPVDRFANGVTVELAGTPLAPGVSGSVKMTQEPSGLRMVLEAPGLPRRDGGNYYQAWLRGPDGLVPVGTFHDADEPVWLWAGVSYEDFPTFTVTEEVADGNQESSGQRVLAGTFGPSATSTPTTK